MDTSLKGRTLDNLARTIIAADAPSTTREHRLYLAGYTDALLWVRRVIEKRDSLVKAVSWWIESRKLADSEVRDWIKSVGVPVPGKCKDV